MSALYTGYNMILSMVHATSCMQIIGIWSYKLGIKVMGAAIHSISHASVSDRPNTVYLLFATLSYAKSLRNLIVATESVWMNGINLWCKLIHFLTKRKSGAHKLSRAGRGLSLQRDKLEEDGKLREGQVEVLHYPQHCFRLDVGSARPQVTRLHHFIHQ